MMRPGRTPCREVGQIAVCDVSADQKAARPKAGERIIARSRKYNERTQARVPRSTFHGPSDHSHISDVVIDRASEMLQWRGQRIENLSEVGLYLTSTRASFS